MLPYYIVFPSYCGPNFLFYIEVTQRRHHVCVVMIVGKRESVCRYGKDRSFALRLMYSWPGTHLCWQKIASVTQKHCSLAVYCEIPDGIIYARHCLIVAREMTSRKIFPYPATCFQRNVATSTLNHDTELAADREITVARDVKEKPHYFDFRCEEVLLRPSLIYQYDVDIRKDLRANVGLSGGTTETCSLLAPNVPLRFTERGYSLSALAEREIVRDVTQDMSFHCFTSRHNVSVALRHFFPVHHEV